MQALYAFIRMPRVSLRPPPSAFGGHQWKLTNSTPGGCCMLSCASSAKFVPKRRVRAISASHLLGAWRWIRSLKSLQKADRSHGRGQTRGWDFFGERSFGYGCRDRDSFCYSFPAGVC